MMLGTQGGPIPGARAATATALVVDGAIYLVDAGAGLPIRFSEARLNFAAVRALFVTHLHSDHYADAFTFLTVNWTNWDFGRQLIQVHGPGRAGESGPPGSAAPGLPERPTAPLVAPELSTPGLADFFEHSIAANAYDINLRLRSTRRENGKPMDLTGLGSEPMMRVHHIATPSGASVSTPTPPMAPIPVYSDDRVTVSATLVEHPPVFPAFAFKFETPYGSVVFSGDTTPCDNLRTFAEGTDVLVNEVMDIGAAMSRFEGKPIYNTMATQFSTAHTPSTDWRDPSGRVKEGVGRFAASCGAKSLVLNHIYPESVPDEAYHDAAAASFGGPVVVSRDLMPIDLASLR